MMVIVCSEIRNTLKGQDSPIPGEGWKHPSRSSWCPTVIPTLGRILHLRPWLREECFLVVFKKPENCCVVKAWLGKTIAANGFCRVPKYLGPRIRGSVLLEQQHGARHWRAGGSGSPAALWVSRSWGRVYVPGSRLHLCPSWDSQKAAAWKAAGGF